ncbi:MAG: Na/Pi cotransporter family protein [Thermoguttaceae bacterium]|nr:Na/Pi cotransporter family protein [Thermoguttaceae bacterium]
MGETAESDGGSHEALESGSSAAGKAPSKEETKRIEKWIPDQKILEGAPPTVISLSDVIAHFRDEKAFGDLESIDPDLVQIKVVQNSKKNVVTPVIEGNQLRLIWNGTRADQTSIMLEFDYQGRQVYDSFNVEVWKPKFWMMGLVVLGGIGIFIFGMKNLSEGIQRLAGPSLRRMIAMFTEHRLFAFGTGILITILLQSSMVTTLMTIGFVNTQIVSLSQAIGVILGANIGTTITSWILTLNISAYSLPLIGVSSLFFVFFKNERVKNIAAALMGLGFLFFGLKLMGQGFSSLKELPEFSAFLQMFSADSFWGLLKCICAGCVLTVLIQSSAASIGIVMSLSMIGAIDDFPTAVAFILGENIGTTFTAVIASLGTSTNAKRAAAFHALFNVLGVCWVLSIYRPVFIPLVEHTAGALKLQLIPFGIPLAHSLFNITNALIFLPFTKLLAKLLTRIIPERENAGKTTETGLDPRHIESNLIAVLKSRLIVERMGERCRKLGETIFRQVRGSLDNEREIQQSFHEEEALDRVQDEIIRFCSAVLSTNPTADSALQARQQIRIADEIESVSDYFISLLKSDLKLKSDGITMPELVRNGLKRLDEKTLILFKDINRAYGNRVKARYFLEQVYSTCRHLTVEIKELRAAFMTEMEQEHYDPILIVAVNSQLTFYRRIWEHLQNVVEVFCSAK